MADNELNFVIERLGECRLASPMAGVRFVNDDERVLYHTSMRDIESCLQRKAAPPGMELAGPREKIYFDPSTLRCGIVTCGGLCPGLNDVIRAIVMSLHFHYGVRQVLGFPFGYEGLSSKYNHKPMDLTPENTSRIHETGGTILGSSRGNQDVGDMVDTLERMNIGILFALGGDGTLRGATAISREARRRGLKLSVIGIPKTIDNDISYVQKSFGFETAVSEAKRATYAAHSEAIGARNGIGLVKLMGRDSGFIAAYSVLVDSQVNFCLVPEVPFTLKGFLAALEKRLERRGHAVIVVAEGAGQDLMPQTGQSDASGNVKYGDIGLFLRDAIKDHCKNQSIDLSLKYIDPSYIIRSLQAIPHDSAFCLLLGHSAVHAGMAGRTDMVVSFWSQQFTHVPIELAVSARKKIDPQGWLWSSVLETTGQPADMR
jgi:6-phosphofructokinase 1